MAATVPQSMTAAGTSPAAPLPDAPIPFPASRRPASNPLIQKLEHACELDEADRAALQAPAAMARHVRADCDLSREGDRPETVHLVIEGFAYRYKTVSDGKRQILGLLLPGDFCNLHVPILARRDHSIGTFTPCQVTEIPRATIIDLITTRPRIAHAFWWAALVDEGIMREWMISMGQRSAVKMVAHLFCELLVRLQAVGCATETSYDVWMTQNELADLFGLTPVHVNRTLRDLHDQNRIVLKGSRLQIPDVGRLKVFSGFNPNYLHLDLRSPEA